MEALLILGGLLLMLAGLVWLVSQAFATSLFWGLGSLVPPLTLAFVFSHWRVARKAFILSSLGLIPLIVGLSLLASRDAERLEAIFSLRWLPTQEQPDLAMGVRGKLNGRKFTPQQGEAIKGVLTLREGQGFFARQEVTIRLREPVEGALRVDVLPDDLGALPEVEIAWLNPDQELPETRRLDRGYTLHLNLQPVAPNKLRGDFHLILPPQYETSLTGVVELDTDRLRYLDGQVDRRHDSRETLAFVIEDYLQRRHASPDVTLQPIPAVTLPADELEVQVQAQVKGEVQPFTLNLAKGEQGWYVKGDAYPPLAAPAAKTVTPASKATDPALAARPQNSMDKLQDFSIEQLLRNPGRYLHRSMRAHTERGGVAEGRFAGLDGEGNLVIRRVIRGPGEATYNLAPGEIVLLELVGP
ncbi:MFS transporter [Pseudomonas stutzeri]|uniref:MFS transporter n=1 Tax=Stutzerimonas stutzeri TaxID=316 RepID=A0A2N8RZK2_STUST|nr:MFS transporter [Stutzerimonas stutzeri]MCQ4295115.1 MFS transporter [Stutzerimonas stutzeri]PNF79781.1 MFS transporter [Stutzerimonas stutzeri]